MRRFFLIAALVVLGLAGGWFYRYYTIKEKVIGIKFPRLALEKTEEAVQALKTAGQKLIAGPLKTASGTQSFLANISEKGLEEFKELKKLPGKIQEGGIQISTKGIEFTKSGRPSSLFTAGIVIKVGQQLSFLIRSAEEPLLFEIDWQDGQKDNGGLDKNEEKIIAHVWEKAGDYAAMIKITGLNFSQSSSFPARVAP